MTDRMPQPMMTPYGEGYLFEWPNNSHKIKIENIREKNDRDPYAEISVVAPDEDGLLKTIIGPKWAGLLAPRVIPALGHEFARALYPGSDTMEARMIAMIEDAARRAQIAYSQGPSVLHLVDYIPDDTDLKWLLSPVIPEKQPTVIVANGGGGKSYLGLSIASTVAAGLPFPGVGRPVSSGPVLYLDWETEEHDHGRRLGLIQKGLGFQVPRPNLCYLKPRQKIESCRWIASRIAELKPVLVVIDSVGYAMGGDLIDPGPVTDMFRQINGWGVSTLLLHHTNREGGFYGSAYLWNSSRSFWEMGTEREYKGLKLTLTQTKMTNGVLHPDPIELRLRFGEDRISWSGRDIYAPIHQHVDQILASVSELESRSELEEYDAEELES